MTHDEPTPAVETNWPAEVKRQAVPLVALILILGLHLHLALTRSINWDEFFFWHEAAKFADGELARPLQTIHVRMFSWLAHLHSNSVDAIIAARIFMFALELVTLVSIISIGRHFADLRSGVVAALLYFSAGFVLQHGTSFRADPMLAASLLSALALLATSRLRLPHILLFAALAGLGGMISMKAVLYGPAFAGVAWMRWEDSGFSRERLVTLAICTIASLLAFGAFYWWHSLALPPQNAVLTQGGTMIAGSGSWVFFLGIPPYWQMALKSMLVSPVLYGCIFAAPVMIWCSQMPRSKKIAMTGMWLPITSLFFYTNTAAYFYVFILAPVALACLLPAQWLVERYGLRLMAGVLLAISAGVWLLEDRTTLDRQRQTVENAQEIFTHPVAYFDQNFMLGAWPKGNGLMTPWGRSGYFEAARPAYREAMEMQTIPLIIANSNEWQAMLGEEEQGLFMPADEAAIRNNFIAFSHPLWIAGKRFAGTSMTPGEEFLVPGPYTVTGGSILIDGREYSPGNVIEIARGTHSIAVPGRETVTLTWGDNLTLPDQPVQPGPLYVDF